MSTAPSIYQKLFCLQLMTTNNPMKPIITLCVFLRNSLRLTQHPIDAMLQFHANTNVHENVDVSVNGP